VGRHVAPAVVHGEQEAAGQVRRPLLGAQERVEAGGPRLHARPRERRDDHVPYPLVPFGGQQVRLAQQVRQPESAAFAEAPQLHVAARGEGEVAVAEAVCRVGQREDLTGCQHAGREAEPGQRPVVGAVQPERAGARVTALADTVPYVRFTPVLGIW
jgi:hypothetical protein